MSQQSALSYNDWLGSSRGYTGITGMQSLPGVALLIDILQVGSTSLEKLQCNLHTVLCISTSLLSIRLISQRSCIAITQKDDVIC